MFSAEFLENAINFLLIKDISFDHIAKMNINTIANKMDLAYDFYNKHNMCAVDWKLKALNKKNTIDK